MGNGIGADLLRDLDLALGDQRARNRGAQQILALVQRIAAHHRRHEIAHELLAQVVDENLLHAHQLGLGARGLQLLALPQIRREGHDLAIVGGLQPLQDHRRVEPAGKCQHNLLHRIAHDLSAALPV